MISWLQTKFASQYSKFVPSEKIIAVAGSFDQKTTALASKAVLSQLGEIVSSTDFAEPKISKTLLKVGPKVKKAIFELPQGHIGQMDKFLELVKPQVGILVGLDLTNAELAGSFEQILEQSSKLLQSLPATGAAILNWDDLSCRKLSEQTPAEVIFFGTDPRNCQIWAGNITLRNFKISFELNYGVERIEINTDFIGKHQIYPILAVAALGIREGLRLTQIKKGLETILPLEHQFQLFSGYGGSLVLDDSGQNSPALLEQNLETLNYLPARRRILVLGEIKHLGSFAPKIYKTLAHKIYKEKLDLVFLVKGETKLVAEELLKMGFIAEQMEQELTNPQVVASLLKVLAKGDVVLIAGSKELRLDEVVAKITKK